MDLGRDRESALSSGVDTSIAFQILSLSPQLLTLISGDGTILSLIEYYSSKALLFSSPWARM